ncbi:MAG: LppP/LprE family lipoprotein [Candidatus Rokubacteria bacterium]|nr:LppP/LprE family lipoprotein [Candidatus Rokubacteria bacterium]
MSTRARVRVAAGALIVLLVGSAPPAAGQGPATGAWLDHSPPVNWNTPGARLPAPRPVEAEAETRARCAGTLRRVTMREDRALARAGWRLVGPYQHFSGTSVVTGSSGWDGMCRPLGYQVFVFVDGILAGTLSPVLMDSRTDGAESRLFLFQATELSAEFLRYREADPLCCPSRVSRVTYRIERTGKTPILVPTSASTELIAR